MTTTVLTFVYVSLPENLKYSIKFSRNSEAFASVFRYILKCYLKYYYYVCNSFKYLTTRYYAICMVSAFGCERLFFLFRNYVDSIPGLSTLYTLFTLCHDIAPTLCFLYVHLLRVVTIVEQIDVLNIVTS